MAVYILNNVRADLMFEARKSLFCNHPNIPGVPSKFWMIRRFKGVKDIDHFPVVIGVIDTLAARVNQE
jgi:hypothetical protein